MFKCPILLSNLRLFHVHVSSKVEFDNLLLALEKAVDKTVLPQVPCVAVLDLSVTSHDLPLQVEFAQFSLKCLVNFCFKAKLRVNLSVWSLRCGVNVKMVFSPPKNTADMVHCGNWKNEQSRTQQSRMLKNFKWSFHPDVILSF